MQKHFIIVSELPHHGGPLVLHLLCHLLNKRGIRAEMFIVPRYIYNSTKKELLLFWTKWALFTILDIEKQILLKILPEKARCRIKPLRERSSYHFQKLPRRYFPIILSKTIVVYPEIVFGNPLKANKVVRWFLYYNKYSGKNAFGSNDLFFCYRKIFNDRRCNPEEKMLNLNFFDKELYKNYNSKQRTGICYCIRKGRKRDDVPKKFDGPIIDELSEEDKVKTFNECSKCYFYDMQTFYTSIAVACGCIPVCVLEKGKEKRDYLSEGEMGYGVAYGDTDEEINFAERTRMMKLNQLNFDEGNNQNILKFIDEVNDFWL
ncbi:MAG: hypothetical protein M0P13_01745 [Fibrobacteraceae bacterium]|nr:hypothetical protein [Fibrobacteraceae bacterium]